MTSPQWRQRQYAAGKAPFCEKTTRLQHICYTRGPLCTKKTTCVVKKNLRWVLSRKSDCLLSNKARSKHLALDIDVNNQPPCSCLTHLQFCCLGSNKATSNYREGVIFAPGIFQKRRFRTGFRSQSGLKIPWEISHHSKMVLFAIEQFLPCTANFEDCFWEFLGTYKVAFCIFRSSCMTWISIPCPKVQGSPALAPLSALGHSKHQFSH